MRIRSPFVLPALLAAALGLAGCGGAYADALARGDAMARAGAWDEAARSYELAVQMDPGSDEARSRLAQARRGQAAARVGMGWALLERGDVAGALGAMQDAARLDPTNPEVRRALDVVTARALGRAESLLSEGRARDALDLALLVRRGAPSNPRALEVEGRARDALAAETYARAEAFAAAGKRGSALLAFAEATRTRPGFRDAAARAADLRRDLEGELRFFAVIDPALPSPGAPQDLAAAATHELRASSQDQDRPLLAVVDRAPSPAALGIRLGVKLDRFTAAHDVRNDPRSCTWVCATDRVPNPAYEAASLEAADAERRSAAAEKELSHASRALDAKRRDERRTSAEVERTARELQRAKRDLTDCEPRTFHKPGKPERDRCSDEEKAVRAAEQAHDAAEAADQAARGATSLAESQARNADLAQGDARRAWKQALARLARTPSVLEKERSCTFVYNVGVHTAREEVALVLRAGVLGEGEPSDLPPVRYEVSRSDEAFDALPGRCPELAAGDPLSLPSRSELDSALVARVVTGVRESLQGSYDDYRRGFLESERRERAAGRRDEAREARVRWLLTGPGTPEELVVTTTPG